MFPSSLQRPVSLACALLCWGAASSVARAQAAPSPLPSVFVTAQRGEQAVERVVADVSVVERADIERSGALAIADVLARLPGVELARNGGPGAATSVFVRGAEGRFTAVYVDGVRVDSQSTGGATWESIPLGLVDRIEVLRGPASAVYGSDALAGAIQIFTRRASTAFAPAVALGVGSQGTAKLSASASGQQGPWDYTVGLASERSQGFNSRPTAGQNPDRDGYRSTGGHARLGLQADQRHRLEASVLVNRLDSQFDSAPAPGWADERNRYRLQTASAQWRAQWSDAYRTRLSLSESQSRYESAPFPYLTLTRLRGAVLQNEWDLGAHQVSAALEKKIDRLDNAPFEGERSMNAVGLGYSLKSGSHALQLNLRRDQNSDFGGKTTGSAAYAYTLLPGLRASASVGTGFRAPTLFQQRSEYGVPGLQPESSQNAEVALRHAQGRSEWGAVVYRADIRNLIAFANPGPCASPYGCYANTERARLEGLTLSGRHALGPVALRGSIDLQNPRDLDTGKLLARRAKRHATLGADLTLASWLLGAEVQASGARYSAAGETQPLAGFGVLNLLASTQLAPGWRLHARADNLANRAYQWVDGYATAGRTVYVGLHWAPR